MPWAGAALERSGTLTRGRAGSRAVLGGKMEWKVAAISLGRTMGWTMLIFKRIKRYLFFTSKKDDCPTRCPTGCNSVWARPWQSVGRPGPRR